jgi:hypothetical protein
MKCVPFALGFVSGRPINEVLAILQEDGGYGRRKMNFPRGVYIPALAKLGVRVLDRRVNLRATVRTWVRDIANPASTWILRVSGHLMVGRDGKIFDISDPTGSGESLRAYGRSILTHAWKVAA